jgi:hypothetical protein
VRTAPLTVFGHHRHQANDLKLFSDPVKSETTIFITAPGGFNEGNLTKGCLIFDPGAPQKTETGPKAGCKNIFEDKVRGIRAERQPRQGTKIKSEEKRLTSSVPRRDAACKR